MPDQMPKKSKNLTARQGCFVILGAIGFVILLIGIFSLIDNKGRECVVTLSALRQSLSDLRNAPTKTDSNVDGNKVWTWDTEGAHSGFVKVITAPNSDNILQTNICVNHGPSQVSGPQAILAVGIQGWWRNRVDGSPPGQLAMVWDVVQAMSKVQIDKSELRDWLIAHVDDQGAAKSFGTIMVTVALANEELYSPPQGFKGSVFNLNYYPFGK